ncbi:MAG: cyclic nucleotide-binding domain-containing protein [Deltaproteobacteria bacterium]|nr:cyclic nucleotide-binding domain-containing protein [Candidatus Zymogenaceae bacterium]
MSTSTQDTKQRLSRLKEEGALEIGRGNCDKALRDFLEVLKVAPNDIHALMKVGDCCHKLGRNDEACRYYDRLVDVFSSEGFVVKAIAVHKLILKINPGFSGGEKRLSTLYEKKIAQTAPVLPAKGKTAGPHRDYEKPPLFSDLSHDEFVAVIEKLTPADVGAEGMIIRQGEPGDSIFIVVSGQVSIFRRDEDKNEVWITNLGEGSFFGEFGYFSGQKRFASVKAVEDTTLLEIGRKDLESIIAKHPRVREVMFKFYKERILDTLLAISPLFCVLSPEERGRLMKEVSFSTHKKGTRIVREGEVGDLMYVIISGEVEVATEREAMVVPLALLKSGDFFGEVAVITDRPRTATVTAKTDISVAEISKGSVAGAIGKHPEIEQLLSSYIQMRVENTISTFMQFKNRKIESGLV